MYSPDPKTKQSSYPRAPNDNEFYKKDNNDKEVYIVHNNIENYAFNTETKEEIYAKDKNVQYYAKYDHKQVYAIDLNKDLEKFIRLNHEDQYTKNKYKIEFYPLNFVGSHKVAKQFTDYFYAKGENQEFYYPLDEYSNEFAIQNASGNYLIIVSNSGYPIAPKKRNGSVNYIKLNNTEIPYLYKNVFFIGKNSAGDDQYPLDVTQEQYYPDDNTLEPKIAKDHRGRYKYALSKYNKIKYPMFENENTYIIDENSDSYTILLQHLDNFHSYAKCNGKEMYPKKALKNNHFVEMMVRDLYAKENNKKYYPKDSKNNEYINSVGDLLESYPVTCDNSVIIPNHENKPLVKPNDSDLSKQIQCLLYRPDFKRYDFLTNCSSKSYPLLHSESFLFTTNYLQYIKVALYTIAFLLFFILLIK